MKKILVLGAGLLVSTMNVNAMPQHEAPFVGINPVKNKCHIIAEDGAFLVNELSTHISHRICNYTNNNRERALLFKNLIEKLTSRSHLNHWE